jgi:hypothetical protein
MSSTLLIATMIGAGMGVPTESFAQSRERGPGARPTPPPGGGGRGGPPPSRGGGERPPPPSRGGDRPAPPPVVRPPRGGDRPAPPPVVRPPRGGDRPAPPPVVRPPRGGDRPAPPPVVRPPRGGDRPAPPPVVRPPRGGDRPAPPPVVRPPRGGDHRPLPPVVRPPVVRPPVDRDFVRERIRREREHRVADIRIIRERIRDERSDWRHRRPIVVHRDVVYIRSPHTWSNRYDRWSRHTYRPSHPILTRPIRWYEPIYDDVPAAETLEATAVNMENLAREVYEVMDGVIHTNPNREYAERLMRVLGEMVDASENFTDTVYDREDYQETLYDLFYLEEKVEIAIRTLYGYSKEYLVEDEMRALDYYVEELLWQYQVN